MKPMSKFRANRQEREHGGERAQAHEMGIGAEVPAEQGEPMEGQAPDEGNMAAEHGPAMETHITHDHEGGVHHTHSIHPDGFEHHMDHASADEAHMHAAKAAGVEVPEGEEKMEGKMEHKPSKKKHESEPEDDYQAEELD